MLRTKIIFIDPKDKVGEVKYQKFLEETDETYFQQTLAWRVGCIDCFY